GGATDTTIGNLKTPSGSSASSSKKATGATAEGPVNTTDELGRRVWDKAFYESLAQTKEDDDDFFSYLPQPRQRKIAPPVEHRKALQRRDFHIDLAKEIGKTKIVTLQTPRMQQGGFWCDVCECLIKDSAAYLDHINGRNHNRMLGMTMRVERATPARVIGKLRELQRVAQVELEGEDPSSAVEPSGAASSSGGSSGVTGGSGAGSSSASSNSHHHHSMSSTHTGSLTGSDERGSGGVGTSSSAAGGAGQYGEENYDDIDRIKRRLEELQRQDEERKLRKKMKKRKKEKAEGEGDTKKNGVTKDEGGDAAERQGDAEEDEEQKMLKAMGLPSSFVGT
ncbi:zinc finger protein, partial [Cystoisospora suis]